MSLINQMLRDLDRRNAVRTLADAVPAGLSAGSPPPIGHRQLSTPLLATVAVVLLVIATILLLDFGSVTAAPEVSSPVRIPPTAIPPSTAGASSPPPPTVEVAKVATMPSVVTPVATAPSKVEPIPSAATAASPEEVSPAAPAVVVEPNPAMEKSAREAVSPQQQAQSLYQRALNELKRGRQEAAAQELEKAVRLDPHHLAAREALIKLMLANGDEARATTLLNDGRASNSDTLSLALLDARLRLQKGQAVSAITLLEELAGSSRTSSDYWSLLAAAYQRAERFADSAEAYRHALQLRPNQGEWYVGLGISLENVGQSQAARNAYRRAQEATLPVALAQFVQQRLQNLNATAQGTH